jgi:hypothetical protein
MAQNLEQTAGTLDILGAPGWLLLGWLLLGWLRRAGCAGLAAPG